MRCSQPTSPEMAAWLVPFTESVRKSAFASEETFHQKLTLVTTLIVLDGLGLPTGITAAGMALVTGVDRPLDMCRTTVNTLGNLVGTAVVARSEGEALKPE